ncbi:MAG: N-acetyltransferase family protein [Acetanaerobacterium sp.]
MNKSTGQPAFAMVSETHLPEILAIYNHYVAHSTATFHIHPLSLDEMRGLVFFPKPCYATYVMLCEGKIAGYVLLTQHKSREAYDQTAEVTIYLDNRCTGKGLGRHALAFIEDVARGNGFHVLVATICGENTSSIRLFETCGYEKCAHYKEVGMKFDRYLDLIAYEKIL